MTKQVPAVRLQVVALKEPPVVPTVNVNVTIPVGVFVEVVVSATIAVTGAVQLEPPNGMLQLTFATLVEVLSFGVDATVIAAAALVLVL